MGGDLSVIKCYKLTALPLELAYVGGKSAHWHESAEIVIYTLGLRNRSTTSLKESFLLRGANLNSSPIMRLTKKFGCFALLFFLWPALGRGKVFGCQWYAYQRFVISGSEYNFQR